MAFANIVFRKWMDIKRHFQQYFSYAVVVCLGWRKSATSH